MVSWLRVTPWTDSNERPEMSATTRIIKNDFSTNLRMRFIATLIVSETSLKHLSIFSEEIADPHSAAKPRGIFVEQILRMNNQAFQASSFR